ncbi:MAG: TolB family protein, partial [Terriglobales bacterium]
MIRRLLLLVLLLAPFALAQAKHPFTFEDMMALKRVGDPILSPDNNWIVFATVHVNLDANSKTPHLWLIRANGGEAKQLTEGPGEDSPRWSPDSKHILYTSARDGDSQIWVSEFDAAAGALT